MGKKSLLTKEDIDILESWADGYFYKIFYYLEDFVKKGIEQKLFLPMYMSETCRRYVGKKNN